MVGRQWFVISEVPIIRQISRIVKVHPTHKSLVQFECGFSASDALMSLAFRRIDQPPG